eukprot:g5026.t1
MGLPDFLESLSEADQAAADGFAEALDQAAEFKPKSGKLRKLHLLLQSLPWQQRQQTIMAMPESTRRALEGYMLSSRSQKNRTSIPRTRAAHIWRCGAAGFVAAVHLGHGLQAQSAKRQDLASAARHFCVLLRWRAKCQ